MKKSFAFVVMRLIAGSRFAIPLRDRRQALYVPRSFKETDYAVVAELVDAQR